MAINQISWLAGRRVHTNTHTMYHSHEWALPNFKSHRAERKKKEKPNHKLNQINAEKFVSIKRLGDVIYTLPNGIFGVCKRIWRWWAATFECI